jgi:hypothetical protein
MRPAAALLALLFLAPPAPAAKSGAPPILTIRELRALTPEQAAEGRPARITGVITFYDPAPPHRRPSRTHRRLRLRRISHS